MKRKAFLIPFTALIAAIVISGCDTKKTDCSLNETTQLGAYKGAHSILGGAYTFDDSLTITNPIADDNKVTIVSEKLGVPLTGTFDPNYCGKVILDSVYIASQVIESVTLSNVRAGGYGIFDGNKLTTVINIKSGSALLGATNIPLNDAVLSGLFTKQ